MIDAREEFLALKNLHVVEPILFTIDNLVDLDLDVVREKHLQFINNQ